MSVQSISNAIPNGTVLNSDINGTAIQAGTARGLSLQMVVAGTPTGSFKLQASCDPPINLLASGPLATNWSDVADSAQSIDAAGNLYWNIFPYNGAWVRAVYTTTDVEAGSITAVAETGVVQHQTITTVTDVLGSLNSTYFLLSSVNLVSKVQKKFYVWFNINSAGVDPAVPGATGIPITGATGVLAATLATSIRAALNALTNDFVATGTLSAVIVTNVAPGPVTAMADGPSTHATGFTIGTVTTGVTSNLNNSYLRINGGDGKQWYLWMNVAGIGTDPALANTTGVAVAISTGATASTIGGLIRTALASVTSVGTIGGSTSVATFDQVSAQYHGALFDGSPATGFTLSYTSSTASVSSSILILKGV